MITRFDIGKIFKKLFLPLLVIAIIGGILFSINYAFSSYKNLQLENEKLKLEIVKLQGEIATIAKINKENSIALINTQANCETSIKELVALHQGKEVLMRKEISILQNRKTKEKAAKDTNIVQADGSIRLPTETELEPILSEIRIDSIFESYCNDNPVAICKGN